MFTEFTDALKECGYQVSYGVLFGPDFGLAQNRRRLILLASRRGEIQMPAPTHSPETYVTVDEVIGHLPHLGSGEHDPYDSLHFARQLSPLNLKRAIASKPGEIGLKNFLHRAKNATRKQISLPSTGACEEMPLRPPSPPSRTTPVLDASHTPGKIEALP